MDQTLSIIKPDATKRNLTGSINSVIENSGLRIIAQKRIKMSNEQAQKFYDVHNDKPFFSDLRKSYKGSAFFPLTSILPMTGKLV